VSYKVSLIYAWCIYIFIILIIFSIDYYIRISGNDFYYDGLNEDLWLASIVLVILAAGCFIIYSLKFISKKLHKIIYLITNIILGFIFYATSVYLYP